MSVTVSPYKRRGKANPGTWEINIRAMRPDGTRVRLRLKAPATSRTAAQRWGEAREREVLVAEPPAPKRVIPTLAEFAPRFLEFARERQKPSGIAAKERLLRVHLLPRFGGRKLDAIRSTDVQKLKAAMVDKAPKTVNNVLTVLSRLLKMAVEFEILEHVPCSFRLLKIAPSEAGYHDFDAFEGLVEMARSDDRQCYLAVLLGGEAGLRAGEMRALKWSDVDLPKRQMRVQHSEWMGQVTDPKGGRPRVIPMTRRLASALAEHRHLRGGNVALASPRGTADRRRAAAQPLGCPRHHQKCRFAKARPDPVLR